MRHTLSELTGPVYGHETVRENDHDLTIQHTGEPLGERIIVHGHVLDEDGRGGAERAGRDLAGQCLRPLHPCRRPAPGAARSEFHRRGPRADRMRDGYYRFITVKPGAYPWGNHHNAWRPAHIHFSVFGHAFVSRLVTQMYFPGDPAVPVRSDLQFGDRTRRRGCGWSRRSIWKTPSRNGRCATASTLCCAAAMPRRWRRNSARTCRRDYARRRPSVRFSNMG